MTKNNVVTDQFDRDHRWTFVSCLHPDGVSRQRARWLWAQRAKGRDIGRKLNRLFDRVSEYLSTTTEDVEGTKRTIPR